MQNLLVIGIIGLFAQFIDGTLGMGYGVSASSWLIAAGLYPAVASATVHTAEVFTTLVSGGSHLFFGNVKKEWLLPLVIPGVIGGAAGAYFVTSVPGDTIKPYIAGFLLILGALVLYRSISRKIPIPVTDAPEPDSSPPHPISRLKLHLLGLTASFLDAVGGGGWGPIATPGLILSENTEPRKVVGTVNLAEFFITVAISIAFLVTLDWENFEWNLVIALLIGGIIAAPIAAYLCKRMPTKLLGILIGLLLIGLNLRTILTVLL